MLQWRLAIPWTNKEDAQEYVNSFHKQGVKVTGYGKLTCSASDGSIHYLVVFHLFSSNEYYTRIKNDLTNYKEIIWRKQKLLLPNEVKES